MCPAAELLPVHKAFSVTWHRQLAKPTAAPKVLQAEQQQPRAVSSPAAGGGEPHSIFVRGSASSASSDAPPTTSSGDAADPQPTFSMAGPTAQDANIIGGGGGFAADVASSGQPRSAAGDGGHHAAGGQHAVDACNTIATTSAAVAEGGLRCATTSTTGRRLPLAAERRLVGAVAMYIAGSVEGLVEFDAEGLLSPDTLRRCLAVIDAAAAAPPDQHADYASRGTFNECGYCNGMNELLAYQVISVSHLSVLFLRRACLLSCARYLHHAMPIRSL